MENDHGAFGRQRVRYVRETTGPRDHASEGAETDRARSEGAGTHERGRRAHRKDDRTFDGAKRARGRCDSRRGHEGAWRDYGTSLPRPRRGAQRPWHADEPLPLVPHGLTADDIFVYQEKRREAEAALAAFSVPGGQPVDPAQFPLLAAEIGITAVDLQGVAQAVTSTALAWTQVAAVIETARLKAKRDIAEANTTAEINAILSAIAWGA
jgi:hypothetical protein